MWEIAENVVYVSGACNAAIYNLNTGDVYSINDVAKKILEKVINNQELNENEKEYMQLLSQNHLLETRRKFVIRPYIPIKKESKLNLVWLEITQGCNMHCLHCYEGHKHISCKNAISLEQWKSVIDQIIELKVGRVIVIGGEPCIHKDIIPILTYLRSCAPALSITLFTNGYYLDGILSEIVIKNNIDIKVSLYGHNAEVHDRITGVEGSFNKLVDSIIRLSQNGVNINVAITLMKENELYYKDILNFVKALPIKGYKFDVIRKVTDGTQNEHFPLTEKIILQAYRTKANFYANKSRFDYNVFYNSCWNGKMVVTETGDILPCVFSRNHICGNITKSAIKDIIYGETLLSKCWECSLELIDTCCDCEFRYACIDCRATAESTNGRNKKNPRCKYDPYKGRWDCG